MEKATICLSPGPPDMEDEAISLSPGPLDQEAATTLSPRPPEKGVEVITISPEAPYKGVATTQLTLGTPYKLSKKPEVFKGVIVRMFGGRPSLLSCVNKANTTERFYVRCKQVSMTKSSLHFGEGTRVAVALEFAHNCEVVRSGCTYLAAAHFPLTKARVETVRAVGGVTFPRTLSFFHDGVKRTTVLRRRDLAVDGGRPPADVPRDFFKVGATIHLNDCGDSPNATLDVSGNKLARTVDKKKRKKTVPGHDGQIAALRENADGMILPTEATTLVGGKKTRVHLAHVTVNGKTDVPVPPSLFKVGDAVRIHAVRFCAETKRYVAELRRYVPRLLFKKACDEYVQSLNLTTRPDAK